MTPWPFFLSNFWHRAGITNKFTLFFTVLTSLLIIILGASFLALLYVRQAEERIVTSMDIERLALEIDSGMGKARRLHGDFFLYMPQIGLSAAHQQYAQPSIRQAAKVVTLSDKLRELLSRSGASETFHDFQKNLNLYLSSAQRFTETSIRSIELTTKLDAFETGLTAQFKGSTTSLRSALVASPPLLSLFYQANGFFKEFLTNRKRPDLQSAFNVLADLEKAAVADQALSPEDRGAALELSRQCRGSAEEIAAIDRELKHVFNDFALQVETERQAAQAIFAFVEEETVRNRGEIRLTYKLVFSGLFAVALLCVASLLVFARKFDRDVTQNILKMKYRAQEISRGNLDVRCEETGPDELGQLAHTLNHMAGHIEGLVATLEEKVTYRTAQLAESEQRFRHLAESLPMIPVQGYDCERKMIFWNNASERLYGYSCSEALGRKLEDLIIPDAMREPVLAAIREWLDHGVVVPPSEMVRRHKDGSDVQVYSSHMMMSNGRGEKELYSVDIDLTEIKAAQQELDHLVALYQELFAHTNSGVVVYEAVDDGRDFVILDVNRAVEAIEQTAREELLGRRVSEVFPGILEFGLMAVLRRVWSSGQAEDFPLALYQDDKIKGWRENYVYRVASGQVVAVYQDLTKQKQAEEERIKIEERLQRSQKMESIGLMASGVAHDLNNVLSGIVGYPDLIIRQWPDDQKLHSLIQPIKESGKRAAAIVADLLTVARGVASVKVATDLNLLAVEYLDSLEGRDLQARFPLISFETRMEARQSMVSCSVTHIKKSVMNLVINAAEAIGVGAGRVIIASRNLVLDALAAGKKGVAPGHYVALTISDTGHGISVEDQARIFEPFYSKKVMGKSGTGLGLAVVWNTILDHQGAIRVTSSDSGTCFELLLPLADGVGIPPAISRAQEPETPKNVTGQSEIILVVDDEQQLRDLSQQILTTLGYQVTTVSSGEEAVAFLQDHPVDLVILDMLMEPGMNGRETLERILEIYPQQKALIVSGFSESDEVKKAIALGAKGLLQKPYTMQQLGEVVRALF